MRSKYAFFFCAAFVAVSSVLSPAWADSRVFIVANQPDGYGVDQCLAKGDSCGASVARAYCESRQFVQASSYRQVDPDEITSSVPGSKGGTCAGGGCENYVAITCQR